MISRRGGVLLDLFIIAAILAAALAGVVAWKRGDLAALARRLPLPSLPPPAASPDASADLDVSDRSAWIQARVRELLVRQGIDEKHVLKTYNVQRLEGGIQWLEDTLELRRPARFDEASFLRNLVPVLAERRLAVMEDLREGGGWTLALGDRKRVYQRLIFESAR